MFGLSLGLGMGNQAAPGGGGSSRGATNLLTGSSVTPGSGVTYNSGTGVFTVGSGSNSLATWYPPGPLNPSTSYTLSFDYNLTGGSGIKATDGTNTLGTATFTTDGANHSVLTSVITTGATSAGSGFSLAANGGLYGPGTISNVVLTSP